MEGSSAFQFGRAAYRAGLMGRRQLLADAWANVQFRLRGATDADTHALRDRISASLAGTRVKDLDRLGADVLAGVLPRVYPQMLTVAHEHQDAGRRVYIVTAASQELAGMLAHVLALDGAIGSQFSEVKDGVYTGKPTGLFIYRSEKALAIKQLAAREGIDLGESYAYSDSESDLPMLETVGHPVAVNPDRELASIARERGMADPPLRPARPTAACRGGPRRRGRRGWGRERGACAPGQPPAALAAASYFPRLRTSATFVPCGFVRPDDGLLEMTRPLRTRRECSFLTLPTAQWPLEIAVRALGSVSPLRRGTLHDGSL